ncbi:Polyprenyl synthetase [Dillenia turbinata]|uniref:Polyprenyl synthetase n=1 Tax=Dillenia turbinata TaxID=194707 RepID=A0AAN8VQS1_9MAGN
MVIGRGISRMLQSSSFNRCRWRFLPSSSSSSSSTSQCQHQLLVPNLSNLHSPPESTIKAQAFQDQTDPFSIVADELSILANRLRSMVVAEVPKLASAAEYFFKMGVEGKRFRPTILLLMATAVNNSIPGSASHEVVDTLSTELRIRQQCIAEVTEMIHVASLMHDDVLDDAETRRGIGSLNFVMGNKSIQMKGSLEWLPAGLLASSFAHFTASMLDGFREAAVGKVVALGSTCIEAVTITADETARASLPIPSTFVRLFFAFAKASRDRLPLLPVAEVDPSVLYFPGTSRDLLAVLAGDFLLSRACVALASLKNTEVRVLLSEFIVERVKVPRTIDVVATLEGVVSLLATVLENLVTGETMQMTTTSDERCSMEYYLQKTYYKTASLISNSCKAIALLAGQTAEVSMLAYEYGKNLGLAYQLIDDVLDFTGTSASLGKGSLSDIRHGIVTAPILFAIEEFPQLRAVVDRGFDNPADVELIICSDTNLYRLTQALEYLGKSHGIQRTKELAKKHAILAAAAIDSLPNSNDEGVRRCRRALVDLTERVITRTK